MRWLLVLLFALTGCIESAPPVASGDVHVIVVGGTVTETGPEPENQGVCDVAPPPFSADADDGKVWWVDTEWYWQEANPTEARVLVIRVDQIDRVYDDDCWTPQLQLKLTETSQLHWGWNDFAQQVPMQSTDETVTIAGETLEAGDTTTWEIDAMCTCEVYYGDPGTYEYQGTLNIAYLGKWDLVRVNDWQDLPPLHVPYWDGY